MFVYVFQGVTVGWWKKERHSSDTTARSAGFKSRPDGPPIRVVSSRKEKGEERVDMGGHGWPGKVPRSPAVPYKEKERKNKT
ncbi:hypothetical protein MTP99_003948 [Tenebrio molitor]|jgi:hypothetical protein|nr:hypothetical protein MTP99_003948 [Tenebrio molitor]